MARRAALPIPGSTTNTAPRLRHVGEVTSYPTHTDRCLRGSQEARTLVTRHPKSTASSVAFVPKQREPKWLEPKWLRTYIDVDDDDDGALMSVCQPASDPKQSA